MIEPDLKTLAKAICCPVPGPKRRCSGDCQHAIKCHYPQAVAVRAEYRAAQRPVLRE